MKGYTYPTTDHRHDHGVSTVGSTMRVHRWIVHCAPARNLGTSIVGSSIVLPRLISACPSLDHPSLLQRVIVARPSLDSTNVALNRRDEERRRQGNKGSDFGEREKLQKFENF
jgi:hypothetical protein